MQALDEKLKKVEGANGRLGRFERLWETVKLTLALNTKRVSTRVEVLSTETSTKFRLTTSEREKNQCIAKKGKLINLNPCIDFNIFFINE